MAILGKFETICDIPCMRCKKRLKIRARSLEWTGDLRTELACTTPGCNNVFKSPKTKGNVSSSSPVQLLTLLDGNDVFLEEYECSEEEALHFCELFRDVLQRIPTAANEAILAHWQTGRGSPHVWLLKDRREWDGKGWAASRTEGLSLCVVSTLVGQIPDEHIKTAIAHEVGHTLFIAGNEPNHEQPVATLESLFTPISADPLRKLRPEWLVWRLMEAWSFDQPAMEVWMERHMIDDANGITLRDCPLTDAQFEGRCIAERKWNEERLKQMVFPTAFEKYRSS